MTTTTRRPARATRKPFDPYEVRRKQYERLQLAALFGVGGSAVTGTGSTALALGGARGLLCYVCAALSLAFGWIGVRAYRRLRWIRKPQRWDRRQDRIAKRAAARVPAQRGVAVQPTPLTADELARS